MLPGETRGGGVPDGGPGGASRQRNAGRADYSLLIGESATGDVLARIRAAIERDEAVRRLAALHIMRLGPDALLVAADVEFRPDLTAPAIQATVRRLEDAIAATLGHGTSRRLILIEPAAGRTREAAA